MRDVLSEDEIREGWRLACCASAAGRVVIDVEQWSLRVLTDEAHVPIEPRPGRGAVIDLGTTTLVAQVVDLASGEVLRVETALNPQSRYGADVMTRLQYDLRQPGELGRLIREELGRMLGGEPLSEVLLAGNTAMHHLFCGLDVEPLTHAPFLSPTLGAHRFEECGIRMARSRRIPAVPGWIRGQRSAVRHRRHSPGRADAAACALRHRHQRRGDCGIGAGNCVCVHGGRPRV